MAVHCIKPGGNFEIVERDIPAPGPGWVRIKVQACVICHSDSLIKEGHWPGIQYPRAPGHEIAGVIDAVGPDVPLFKPGQRVGLGWHGGHCNYCPPCRRGDFMLCENQPISGINYDGGYADYVLAPANAVAFMAPELNDTDAAPLLCAGVTTFNALRNSGARTGDTVAIVGIGGLGHLAIQYAAKAGYRTIAVARGQDKAALAKQLGAHLYIDTTTQDPAKEIQKIGGANIILSTITSAKALEWVIDGLAPAGKFILVGAPDGPVVISPFPLLLGRRTVAGWPSGTGMDSEDTLKFSALTGVKSINEVYPLEKAEEAYARMMSGKARFRVVLKVSEQ